MALEFVSGFGGFALSPLLQEVFDRMQAVAADTINLVYNSDIETQLKDLETALDAAQRTLGNVDGWDLIASKSHSDWLANIRRACYDAEDYIDDLRIEINKIGEASLLLSFFRRVIASHKMHNLQSNLHSLVTESDSYRIPRSSQRKQHHLDIYAKQVVVPVLDVGSFMRTKEKNDIARFVLQPRRGKGKCSSKIMMTVLISGMFGIGKSTLAQASEQDSVLEYSLDKAVPLLLPGLRSWYKGRRILIVLDDLCNFVRPQEDWEEFESVLCEGSAEFGVIITTRNPKVATTVASHSSVPTLSHYLQPMSDEDCASLILHKANSEAIKKQLLKRSHCGKTTLETNMLEIARKFCKGSPLVADIIGHRLSSKHEVAKWSLRMSESLWSMPEFREQIFPAFRLNYSDLSAFLRNSLPYFSLFSENYNFNKDELVQLWMAEGFIRPQVAGVPRTEYSALEELGNYAFDEVLSQSVLQIHCPFNQEPQIYRMHEFIRCYAQYIGSDMYVRIDQQLANIALQIRKVRHISFVCPSTPPALWKDIEKCEGLRTILSLHDFTEIGRLSYTLFLKLQWLRVLVLTRTDIDMLPESLGKLKHLGFLDVSETKIKELPESTICLLGLQVLKLNLCSELLQLPKGISTLTQLLHLEVDMKRLSPMPPHIGRLSNLRSLRAFKVGRNDGYCVTELRNMNYLEGSICLTNLENVKDEAESREAKLNEKPFLKRVELEWRRNLTNQSLAERILAGFEPHENLEELQVNGYGGAQFPSWLTSPECKLTTIHILRCEQCSTLPALGKLQHLKTLHIEEMHLLKYIDRHLMGSGTGARFVSLESLKFQYMTGLVKWEGLQANQMPRLRDLFITDCPNLTSLPQLKLLTCLEHLEISNCPALEALPGKGLPSSLKTLIIIQCDFLKQRCLPNRGADWEKIKTVSNIFIDFKRISSPGS
ncbi:hypothetical protein Cgig2_026594 [Carnegiea gigantea]|uniref:Uncharacterized protein n=1 Tax=Carnegiea gigantea TaxID=171969 RepID=A0A9Q1QLG2_9CARY|nr:hypothetical protein Cgig2_026594 [Carnegiea gigantea]